MNIYPNTMAKTGLDLKIAKQETYFQFHKDILIKSFQNFTKKFIPIAIADVLFYVALYFSAMTIYLRVLEKYRSIATPSMEELAAQGLEKAQSVLSQARGFYFLVIFSIILFLLISIVLVTVFKGFIWQKVAGQKLSGKFFQKFMLLNLCWVSFWFMLIFTSTLVFQGEGMVIITRIVIILGYLITAPAYSAYLDGKIIKSAIKGARLFFTKTIHFLPSSIILAALIVIISSISNFIMFQYPKILSLFPIALVTALFLFPIALVIAFNRFQVFEIVKRLQTK